jgi:hypothetical protein
MYWIIVAIRATTAGRARINLHVSGKLRHTREKPIEEPTYLSIFRPWRTRGSRAISVRYCLAGGLRRGERGGWLESIEEFGPRNATGCASSGVLPMVCPRMTASRTSFRASRRIVAIRGERRRGARRTACAGGARCTWSALGRVATAWCWVRRHLRGNRQGPWPSGGAPVLDHRGLAHPPRHPLMGGFAQHRHGRAALSHRDHRDRGATLFYQLDPRSSQTLRQRPCAATGAWKTVCTGASTSCLKRTPAVSARATPPRS